MQQVKISVVIPTLNSAKTLKMCLESIKTNGAKYSYEIIIVDAGSKDETLDIARSFGVQILNGEPGRINRNIGIKIARGDIICFTDSDCIVPAGWMDGLVGGLLRLHEKDKMIVGVGGGNVPLLEDHSLEALAVAETFRSPLVAFRARNTATYSEEKQVIHNPPHNSALFKWAILEAGGFEEEPGYGYGEDSALDARLMQKGYKLFFLPNLCIYHKHPSNYKKFARQMFAYGWGRIKLGRRYKGYFQLHHFGPVILSILAFTPFLFIPWGMAILNALYVAFKKRNILLFFPVTLLTMTFYIAYGFGEIGEIFKYNK